MKKNAQKKEIKKLKKVWIHLTKILVLIIKKRY